MKLRSIEICAGGGGQALGLELAGFEHVALIENDPSCCETLRFNRPHWNVIEKDVQTFGAREFREVDLFAGGVPCPPFSCSVPGNRPQFLGVKSQAVTPGKSGANPTQ